MASTDARLGEAARALLATAPQGDSQPVKWYKLILEMEEFTRTAGAGLAATWHFVHREQYDEARQSLKKIRETHERHMRKARG